MANAWKRDKPSLKTLFLLVVPISLVLLLFLLFLSSSSFCSSSLQTPTPTLHLQTLTSTSSKFPPFNCLTSPQSSPVIAALVEGVAHPFLFSLSDFGTLPEKPHKNIQRVLKGKPFRKPDISATVQEILRKRGRGDGGGVFVDVGGNVGMATFAAAAMGVKTVVFEPVWENLLRICDGVFLNRAWDKVEVFYAAASDRVGNVTIHKVIGRLDNSAISATGAKLEFKSNKEVAVEVATIPLDEVIPDNLRVLLIKIDVQGWESHVLRGASKLLSRKAGEAPYLIYEEDERLLQASNSSSEEIRKFLSTVGYHQCSRIGTDAHCTKE